MEIPYNLVQIRFKNAAKRSRKYNHEEPMEADFLAIVTESDGKCFYCGCEMIASGHPITKVFSVDHQTPLCYSDGTNEKRNLCVACHRCNIVKGTLRMNTFVKLLSILRADAEFYEVYMAEMFNGRKAEKIERTEKENLMLPMSGDEYVKFM